MIDDRCLSNSKRWFSAPENRLAKTVRMLLFTLIRSITLVILTRYPNITAFRQHLSAFVSLRLSPQRMNLGNLGEEDQTPDKIKSFLPEKFARNIVTMVD